MIKDMYNIYDFFDYIKQGQGPFVEKPIQNKAGTMALSKIEVDEAYAKKWNVGSTRDFVVLTSGDTLMREQLYRVGGLGKPDLDGYFCILKYVEAQYKDNITKDKARKPHLSGHWCIIDKNGVEKVVVDTHEHINLIKDSCIYSTKNKYYNIETGEMYGESYSSITTDDYIFLDCQFPKDDSKRGVVQINKKTGIVESFFKRSKN